MNDVVLQLAEKYEELTSISRVIHLVSIRLAMPGDVNDRAWGAMFEQKRTDGHQVRLHSAVRRRIWPEQQNPHGLPDGARKDSRSREQGVRWRADCNIRRHPRVARTPSRPVMSAGLPWRRESKNARIWGS